MESYNAVYVGLTVEKENIIAVALPDEGGFCLASDAVSPDMVKLRRYFERLAARFGRDRLHVGYELLDLDFSLQRAIVNWGISCQVTEAIERPPDQRRKTGRRDAERLARMLRAGQVTLLEAPREQAIAIAAASYHPDLLRKAVAAPRRSSAVAGRGRAQRAS